MSDNSIDLNVKLKEADPLVIDYVSELVTRNEKRQHEIVKLEADKTERDNRIKALELALKDAQSKSGFNLNISFSGLDPSLNQAQVEAILFTKAEELGYRMEKIAS